MTTVVALTKAQRAEQNRAEENRGEQSRAKQAGRGRQAGRQAEAELRGAYLCLDGRVRHIR